MLFLIRVKDEEFEDDITYFKDYDFKVPKHIKRNDYDCFFKVLLYYEMLLL